MSGRVLIESGSRRYELCGEGDAIVLRGETLGDLLHLRRTMKRSSANGLGEVFKHIPIQIHIMRKQRVIGTVDRRGFHLRPWTVLRSITRG